MPLTRLRARKRYSLLTASDPSEVRSHTPTNNNHQGLPSITTSIRQSPTKRSRYNSTPITKKELPIVNDIEPSLASDAKPVPLLSSAANCTTEAFESKRRKENVRKGSVPRSTMKPRSLNLAYHADIEDFPRLPSPETATKVVNLLRASYRSKIFSTAHPKTKHNKTLLDALVATILSQNTSNTNSSRAFAKLKTRFPSWDTALLEGPKEIEDCITCGGLAQVKSNVIHDILTQLKKEHGECSLEFMRYMSTDDAKKVMCAFKGVGPKTASCVLMFALQRPEFPVDTHVCRIAGRLGWIPKSSTPECAYKTLNVCLPNGLKHELHVLLIEHGRKTCKATSPRCSECSLTSICYFFDKGSNHRRV